MREHVRGSVSNSPVLHHDTHHPATLTFQRWDEGGREKRFLGPKGCCLRAFHIHTFLSRHAFLYI